MRPIRTADCNFTFTGPRPHVADLPCERVDDGVFATFELTDEERELILQGGTIRLGLHTEVIPPVSFEVTLAVPEWQDKDLRCGNCFAVYVEGRGLKLCGQCGHELKPASEV